MTADEIIREIERLPSQAKAEVLSVLLRSQAKNSRLSPDQLVALAEEMIAAHDPEEADRLEAEILAGFYGRWAIPRIQRERIPEALMAHLVKSEPDWHWIRQREISTAQLGLFARWLDADPEVPEGPWFKRFPEMIVCGEGALIKTFLRVGQVLLGKKLSEVVSARRRDQVAAATAPQNKITRDARLLHSVESLDEESRK